MSPHRRHPLNLYANRRPVPVPPRVDQHLRPAPEPLALVLVIAETKTDAVDYMITLGADPDVVHHGAPYLRYLRLGLPYQWAAVADAGLVDTSRKGVYVARDLTAGDTVFRYEQGSKMVPVARMAAVDDRPGAACAAQPVGQPDRDTGTG